MKMTSDQLERILYELEQLENSVESDMVAVEVSKVRRNLKKWAAQGQLGDVPYQEQLKTWNIPLTERDTEVADWTDTHGTDAKPGNAVLSEPTPNQENRLTRAIQLAGDEKFREALDILVDLEMEAPSNARIRSWKYDIENRYNQRTAEMVDAAEIFARQNPNDHEKQREMWQQLLEFRPGNEIAKQKLEDIENVLKRVSIRDLLVDLREVARKAFTERNFVELNAIVGNIEGINSRTDLAEETKKSVAELYTHVRSLRHQLSKELEVTVTIVSQGNRENVLQIKKLVEDGKETILDDRVSPPRDVPIGPVYELVRKQYLAGLQDLASNRITEAGGSAKVRENIEAVQKAKHLLEGILEDFDDDILDKGDKAQLSGIRSQVEGELEKVNSLIGKYTQVDDRIRGAADEEKQIAERLKALIEARAIYPEHPHLETTINELVNLIIADTRRYIDRAILDANFYADEEDFEEAIGILDTAEEHARKTLRGKKEFGKALADINTQIGKTLVGVRSRQSAYEKMAAEAKGCRSCLDIYASTKEEKDLRAAQDHLDRIPLEFKDHPLVQEAQREFARSQADPVKWEKGNELYRQSLWAEAENNFAQINRDFPQYAQAQILARRAHAAQNYEKGIVAYSQKEWIKANDLFLSALHDFAGDESKGIKGIGTDEITLPILERCRQELENLKPIAEGEEKVALILSKATKDLEAARKASSVRSLPADKVDLQPAYSKIAQELVKARAEALSRSNDLTLLLSQVRQDWRATYLEGMNTALSSRDTGLMHKALLQADELEKHGLLNEEDKRLRYMIQAEMLDMEYLRCLPDQEGSPISNVNWEEVEHNRLDRYAVESRMGFMYSRSSPQWDASEAKKAALRKEILSITNKRVRLDVNQKIETGLRDLAANGQKAGRANDDSSRRAELDLFRGVADYLGSQMRDNPVLRDDLDLMKEWIHLAWKARDWVYADDIARKLIEYGVYTDGRHLEELFRILTQVARAFAENNIQRGEAYLEQFNNQDQDWATVNQSLISEERKYLRDEVKARLLKEAEDDLQLRTSHGYLMAAQKYAVLYQLDPMDSIVRQGLGECGKHIGTGLESVFARAERMRLGNKNLDEALKEVEITIQELESIKSVTHRLNLGHEMEVRLDEALETAQGYRTKWSAVNKHVAKYEKELLNAMAGPRPLDDDGTGGWRFEPVRNAIEEARREAGRDRDVLDFITRLEKETGKLEQVGERLNQLSRTLMDAVYAEEFETVVSVAQALDNAWVDARRKDGNWDGLSYLIREDYPKPLKEATTPKLHLENSIKQNENWQQWKLWADETERMYSQVRDGEKLLHKPLDELKQEHSLQAIILECEKTMKAVEKLRTKFNDKPPVEPLSEKARQNSERVNASVFNLVQGGSDGVRRLKQEAAEDFAQLNESRGPLEKLRGAIQVIRDLKSKDKRGNVPPMRIEVAKKFLLECEQIDPQHEEIREHHKYLQSLRFQ